MTGSSIISRLIGQKNSSKMEESIWVFFKLNVLL